jgi:hypothetical protein
VERGDDEVDGLGLSHDHHRSSLARPLDGGFEIPIVRREALGALLLRASHVPLNGNLRTTYSDGDIVTSRDRTGDAGVVPGRGPRPTVLLRGCTRADPRC